ncbi:MAG TPA: helix-turn-helix transcriptional regulator [Pseudonocardiaceae bacterium]|nr:helix-turn-helix transcriptional regulator [Pseudonocardiaceae bacterium]
MNDGDAPHPAGKSGAELTPASRPVGPPVDPALWWRGDMRAALRARDIGTVYRLILAVTGMSQYRLAALVGQTQSEVSEILKGRRVKDVAVLERIADRLGIPLELIRLSAYGADGAYCGDEVTGTDSPEGVSAEVLRRHALALGGAAVFGAQFRGLGKLAELAVPAAVPLPEQIVEIHVLQVRNLTRSLAEAYRAYGADPQVNSTAAEQATRLLRVPGSEPVKRALLVAVAELHIRAGLAGWDAGLYHRAMYHLTRGLELATDAGDAYLQTAALNMAGLATIKHGHPNDGLKMLQCAQLTALRIPPQLDWIPVAGQGCRMALQACGLADSATALAALGRPEEADQELGKSRELWYPTRADPSGDLDRPAAVLELARGRLDAAEQFAAASLRRWEGISEVSRIRSSVLMATIHVQAGEPRALALAHSAIKDVTRLSSVRARKELAPLAAALEARPGSDPKELARITRQVAATRP